MRCTNNEIQKNKMNNSLLMPRKIVILHNIISPYKTLLFNALHEAYDNFKVLYISESERRREWVIDTNELKFPYEIMFPVPTDEVHSVLLFRKTWMCLNALNPEILIIGGYSYTSSWAGLFWAKKNKRKIILWSSSNEDDHRRVFYKEFVKILFVRNCDAYNVYGTKSRDYLSKLGAKEDKIFIVGNNTDNDFYYNETAKWRRVRDHLIKEFGIPKKNFLYIGRFSEEKNIFFMLDAFKQAVGDNKGWGMILIGNGPQKGEVEHYIKKFNLENVFMPGFQQKEEIPQYLAVSDVFILPSISETWGLVVNEAMAAGLPVLVSRKCGCYPDIVKDGENGFSFDPFDKDELVGLMKGIIDDKVDLKKMGENSLKIIKNYTPERAAGIIVKTAAEVVHHVAYK